ncbi:GTPase [Corticibacter populi]|uniref:GTPase n=1 Tax=Corticibacter populi TaxID=1550736 RepID=A0A3M6QXW1_9BURK|nr:TerB family tellurite resistance protein [Corticibacter populi]RMX07858.1 GTPase [Corticibacter populi]RZS35093.1 uncharacterized protein (DUF697 family) [Corticibacter populi]
MHHQDIQATLTISLLAAYADSHKHDREREQIRQIAESLASSSGIDLPALYQDVLFKRTSLKNAAASLESEPARQLAYEMAVCVCEADGSTSAQEQAFLTELREALGLAPGLAEQALAQTDALAQAPLDVAADADIDSDAADSQRRASTLSREAIDGKILRAAITNGAIELLPESLSTMAIIPLQMRLVYQIGQSYGYQLDRGHIRDFLATIGVGMTSQYLEQAGRKLLGGLLGKAGKGILGGLGKQAVSSGMSFAATYALGHVANQYYAGGRTLSTQMLKDAYAHVLQDGRRLHSQYLPDMQAQARTLDAGKLLAMVRGQTGQP